MKYNLILIGTEYNVGVMVTQENRVRIAPLPGKKKNKTFDSVASTVLPQCIFITLYFNLLTSKNRPITLYSQIYFSCKNVTVFSFSLSFNGMSVMFSRKISNKINHHIKRSRLLQYRHKFKGYSLNAGITRFSNIRVRL